MPRKKGREREIEVLLKVTEEKLRSVWALKCP